MKSINYITVKQVIFLNNALIKRYNKNAKTQIIDKNLLESSVARPQQTVFGEDAYVSIEDKAAALCESLIKNHPFLDENKRTAFAAMYMFLYKNGYLLIASEEDATYMTLQVANSKINLKTLSSWITNNIKHNPSKSTYK